MRPSGTCNQKLQETSARSSQQWQLRPKQDNQPSRDLLKKEPHLRIMLLRGKLGKPLTIVENAENNPTKYYTRTPPGQYTQGIFTSAQLPYQNLPNSQMGYQSQHPGATQPQI